MELRMSESNPVSKVSTMILMGMLVFSIIFIVIRKNAYDKQIVALQNQIAQKDQEIEVRQGVYQKLAVQTSSLGAIVDAKDTQIQQLTAQLKQSKDQLVTATSVGVQWKQAYQSTLTATQTTVPSTNVSAPAREKVTFNHDFGYIGVNGYTLTNPAEAWVSVQQNRPLKLTVALAETNTHQWRTYVTSSEENVGVDIQVSGINPYVLQPKWYENLEVNSSVGVGAGALFGLGVGAKIGSFSVGPGVWWTLTDHLDKFYGVNVAWRPFRR
jgi:hypothetical protein